MKELWQNQSGKLFLWVPFLMAFGAGIYFNFPFEPNFIFSLILALCTLILSIIKAPIMIRALSLLFFGFCYAAVFTHIINTPQIPHGLHNIQIIGNVTNIDYTFIRDSLQKLKS